MAKKLTPWILLVKKQLNIIKAEGKVKGNLMKEAILRAKKLYVKAKKVGS